MATAMNGLKAVHPRLLFSDGDVLEIKRQIASDSFAKNQYQQLSARGEALLSAPQDTYQLLGPERVLLAISRDIENRVITLSGLYRITGDHRFADRAIKEMLAAASFPDWYPSHFLDTAEMTAALGIGYDWLYPVLSANERATIKDAIITKGINPWLALLRTHAFPQTNNWAQVCYGGETLGVLAIAEKSDPSDLSRAEEVVRYTLPAMANVMRVFAPDGGFDEGPMYWNYATVYNVLYLAALESALGTDFHESEAPGFAKTGAYRIQSIGPTNLSANFGDAPPFTFPAPQMFWLASRFDRPMYAVQERRLTEQLTGQMSQEAKNESGRFDALGLAWYSLAPVPNSSQHLPLVQSFTRATQAYMRSTWSTSRAWYIGVKGGDAEANHGHLDLGSFVLDAFGERWAIDLGSDSYGLPGYFGKERWNYYRTRTEGHNTLTVDGQNEDLDAVAPIVAVGDTSARRFAVVDLDNAYKAELRSWRRGVSILDGKRVLLQDEIDPARPVDVTWHFHTRASVHVGSNGKTATLSMGVDSIVARILTPSDYTFEATPVNVKPPQSSDLGVTDLIIRQVQATKRETLVVLFADPKDDSRVALTPLSTW
jgi:hypothetical protein